MTVVTLQGEQIRVELGKGERVKRIREEVGKRKGIKEGSLVVLLDGKWVDETETLEASGIRESSKVYAVIGNNGLGEPNGSISVPPRPFPSTLSAPTKTGVPPKPSFTPRGSQVPFTPTWGGKIPASRPSAPPQPAVTPGFSQFDAGSMPVSGKRGMQQMQRETDLDSEPSGLPDAFQEDLSAEDLENISNIAAIGFPKDKVRVAYIAATKNPDRAVEILLSS